MSERFRISSSGVVWNDKPSEEVYCDLYVQPSTEHKDIRNAALREAMAICLKVEKRLRETEWNEYPEHRTSGETAAYICSGEIERLIVP